MTINVDGYNAEKAMRIRDIITKTKADVTILTETNELINTAMLPGVGKPLVISGKGGTYDGVACVTQATNYLKISPISHRIIMVSLKCGIGIIGCYGPTELANIKDKHAFWDELSKCVEKEKLNHTALIVIGDMNAGHEFLKNNKISGQRNFTLLQTIATKSQMEIVETEPTWIGKLSVSTGNEIPHRTLDRCLILCDTDYERFPQIIWEDAIADHATLCCKIIFNELSRDTGRPRALKRPLLYIDITWKDTKSKLRISTTPPETKKDPLSEFWRAKKYLEFIEKAQLIIVNHNNEVLDNLTAAQLVSEYLKTLWGNKENTMTTTQPDTPQISTPSPPPTIAEITKAIKTLKNDTAMGKDKISGNCIKANPDAAKIYHEIFTVVWNTKQIPQEWKDMKVKPLIKKTTMAQPNQIRPITIQSTSLKIFNAVIKARRNNKYNTLLHPSQHAYREGHSTSTAVKEVYLEMEKKKKGIVAFLDMSKAFDSITKKDTDKALQRWEIPQNEIQLIKAQYEDCQVFVEHNCEVAEPFYHQSGLKQGCTLSNMIFSLVMADAHQKMDCLSTSTKTKMISYSDDIIIIAEDELSLKVRIKQLKGILSELNLTLNETKTEFLRFNSENNNNETTVTSKTWLGIELSSNLSWKEEAKKRIQKAKDASQLIQSIKAKRKLFIPQRPMEIIIDSLITTHLQGDEDFITFDKEDEDNIKNTLQWALMLHCQIREDEAKAKANVMLNKEDTSSVIPITPQITALRKQLTEDAIKLHNTCFDCNPPKVCTKINKHRSDVHKLPPLEKATITCPTCEVTLAISAFQKHFCKRDEILDATCIFCNKKFKTTSLNRHVIWCCENPERITGRTVKCPSCLEQISTRGFDVHKLQCQNKSTTSSPTGKTTCPICKEEFKNRGFTSHYNSCKLKQAHAKQNFNSN